MQAPDVNTNAVDVTAVTIAGVPFFQFDFVGHLHEADALKAIGRWKDLITPDSKTHLIYNCEAMTGFDTGARRAWQAMMASLKSQIGSIWIVSSNVFILGAAKTMGLLTGFNIKVARSLDKIGE